jgi:aspartyl-tRNA(Asn)/glutamyl-tRNA(Gln) amidotransferase subunit A
MNIAEASEELRRKKISCLELTDQCLAVIARLNPDLNAFITVTAEGARDRARALDAELAAGKDRGPLHGIPIAHKDLLDTRGVRTTSGSKLFLNHIPETNAAVVELLEDAGTILLGKTGLHELAYGVTSENPHFGVIRNPHDRDRAPGGSSGGAGVALATGMCLLATGTDTGGSIRIPASYCGVVGLKPTYGLIDRTGVRPLGLTLDHIGPMAADAAALLPFLDAMAPRRRRLPIPERIRIGMPKNYYFDRVDPEVHAAVERGARALPGTMVEVQVPDIEGLNAAARAILLAEGSAVYEPYMDRREDFGADVLALLDQGRLLPATAYVNAQRLRRQYALEFRHLFDKIDCLVTPTTPIAPPKIGQREVTIGGVLEDTRLATTRFLRGINALGFPALSVPCGRTAAGLPIGMQLIARPYAEELLLHLASGVNS